MSEPIKVLSLGAGVQSSTLALLAAHGEVDCPDAAIFADTQAEPRAVYEWLDWLERQLPFPVHRRTAGSLTEQILEDGQGDIPAFTDVGGGQRGMLRRQCTANFKVRVIDQAVKELAGYKKGQRMPAGIAAEQWVGISTDEAQRMKPSRQSWVQTRWPLIEAGYSRADCKAWCLRNGYFFPPKSSCTFCPYHDNQFWRWLYDNDAEGWAEAVQVDRAIRHRGAYLHPSLVPLEEVDLSTAADHGQTDLFGDECEGLCGV